MQMWCRSTDETKGLIYKYLQHLQYLYNISASDASDKIGKIEGLRNKIQTGGKRREAIWFFRIRCIKKFGNEQKRKCTTGAFRCSLFVSEHIRFSLGHGRLCSVSFVECFRSNPWFILINSNRSENPDLQFIDLAYTLHSNSLKRPYTKGSWWV